MTCFFFFIIYDRILLYIIYYIFSAILFMQLVKIHWMNWNIVIQRAYLFLHLKNLLEHCKKIICFWIREDLHLVKNIEMCKMSGCFMQTTFYRSVCTTVRFGILLLPSGRAQNCDISWKKTCASVYFSTNKWQKLNENGY